MENIFKKCSGCDVEKSIVEFYFKKSVNRYDAWCKSCVRISQRKRWKERKRKAVELMGGKCCKCGYKKNYGSLDFHHVDPSTKEYDWTKLKLRKWDEVVNELKKCILVCRNCHGEIHNPHLAFDDTPIEDDNNLLNLNMLIPTGQCPTCDIAVYGTKYCSVECAGKKHRKVKRPSKDELKVLIEENSWCALGRIFGVSDNAVRKWARSYELI